MKKWLALFSSLVIGLPLHAEIVSGDIGNPAFNVWKPGEWTTAAGDVLTLDEEEAPRDPEAPRGAKGLRLEIRYAPKSFGGWNAAPAQNKLPGKPVKLTGWARKGNPDSWVMEFSFVDSNGKKFKLQLHPFGDPRGKFALTDEWNRFEMEFPSDVVPPITFESIDQNNWNDKNNPKAVTRQFDLYDLRLHTNMEGIAPKDRPCSLSLSFPAIGNIFYAQKERPELLLAATSWVGEKTTLSFEATVTAADGTIRPLTIPNLTLTDASGLRLPLPFTEPGAYTVSVTAKGFPNDLSRQHRYAIVLPPPALNDNEKAASTYGINVHGGSYIGYERFARLGFVWIRDYAYNWDWMQRARGEGAYGGWPWYPKLVNGATENGLLTLPCLMGAVKVNKDAKDDNDPSFTPSKEWRRQLALAVSTFPQITAWELDNETDHTMKRTLDGFGRYCEAFGDVIHACTPGTWAVSPGLAGIYVEETRALVEKGYFKHMDVVNGHRYCGIVAPELSKDNANTGMSEARKTFLRDTWRHWKRAATADGQNRQLWLTEWGWDTRAGQIVTEWEQAAYLQREWVLSMGNGIDKMFWYWYYDSDTPDPKNFFDGCGIFDRFREPKPSAPAFSALRSFLPAHYTYLGYANLSENHMAHMLQIGDRIIALAFKLDKAGPDLEITDPKAASVHNMFGANVPAGRRTLDIAPTWYIGLDPSCEWLQQCPLDLESDFYVRSVPGEPIEVRTTQGEGCSYAVEVPDGWTSSPTPTGFRLVGPAASRSAARFTVIGTHGKVQKRMPVEVDVVPEAYVRSTTAAFDGTFTVDVVNQSASPKTFTLRANLPAGWSVEPAEQTTQSLAPETKESLSFKITASTLIPASEKTALPRLDVLNPSGAIVDHAPVAPRTWTLPRIQPSTITFDGNLADWPAESQFPRWMLGPRGEKELSQVYLAYAENGLYLAFDVDDSKCYTSDPNSFWRAADCLEIGFHGPRADFNNGWKWSPSDHQFWFCPLLNENRVFAGFWGNCDEQKNQSDLPDVKTGLRKTDRGYRMELFVPATRIQGWNATPGSTCGLMFRLHVIGQRDERQFFWPESGYSVKQPWKWAKVILGK